MARARQLCWPSGIAAKAAGKPAAPNHCLYREHYHGLDCPGTGHGSESVQAMDEGFTRRLLNRRDGQVQQWLAN